MNNRRADILESAKEVFSIAGFHNADMDEISNTISDEVAKIDDSVGKIKAAISTYMLFFKNHQAVSIQNLIRAEFQ